MATRKTWGRDLDRTNKQCYNVGYARRDRSRLHARGRQAVGLPISATAVAARLPPQRARVSVE